MCKAFTITIVWRISVKPPKTTGWLTPPLGKYHLSLLLLICYRHVDVTSFYSWVHFTAQFIFTCVISMRRLFSTIISPGVVRSPLTNDCNLNETIPRRDP